MTNEGHFKEAFELLMEKYHQVTYHKDKIRFSCLTY